MIKKNQKFLNLVVLLLTFSISGCNNQPERKVEEIIEKDIDLKISIKRFDQDLFNAKTTEDVLALKNKYPDFYPVYMYQIMQGITGNYDVSDKEAASNILANFTSIPDFGLWLKNRADTIFPNLNDLEKDLTAAMKRYKTLFPKDTLPEFITFLSPLVVNFPLIDGTHKMGIGLDMYLGSDFKVYHSYKLADQFPNYRVRKMRKEYLLRDLITAISNLKIPTNGNKGRVLDEMIQEGKILYMTSSLIPETPDSILMGYNPEQIIWANENEHLSWLTLVDSKVLYSTDPDDVRDYTNDGPFTTAKQFGFGTAPRIGSFIGWKIIQQLMTKNPEMNIHDLLKMNDSDEIITKAVYKP
ncbi:MAG: hypothetical protein H6605_03055 [Flavobacteriales bacterium]|nr:hypothetical protein [Flavobacteriales bacterium]